MTNVTAYSPFEVMASFTARRPPRVACNVEGCARFAALKEFELLRLLSSDKKAFATARRLGFGWGAPCPHSTPHAAGDPQHLHSRGNGTGGSATTPDEGAVRTTARQRRSARRSALRHRRRQREHLLRTRCLLPALFLTRPPPPRCCSTAAAGNPSAVSRRHDEFLAYEALARR